MEIYNQDKYNAHAQHYFILSLLNNTTISTVNYAKFNENIKNYK